MRRAGLLLGAASAAEVLAQLATPVVLTRTLSVDDFGQYRLLWLLVGLLMAVLPFAVPRSLFYFLPRSQGADHDRWITTVLVFMLGAGLVSALVAGTANPVVPSGLTVDPHLRHWELALFCGLWVFGSTLDVLLNAQGLNARQALVSLTFTVLRVAAIVAASLYGGFHSVLTALVGIALTKGAFCLYMARQSAQAPGFWTVSGRRFGELLSYSAPFGLNSALFLIRPQLEQWIVAALFTTAQFGIFTVALLISPLQSLVRQTINNTLLPAINRLHAGNQISAMVELNNRGNIAVALVFFPMMALTFAMAPELVNVMFGPAYAEAADVMRVVACGLIVSSIEASTLMTALRQGPFLLRVDALTLLVGAAGSYVGALNFGLPGASAGGLAATGLAVIASHVRVARLVGCPVRKIQRWTVLLRVLAASVCTTAAICLIKALVLLHIGLAYRISACVVLMPVFYFGLLRVFGAWPYVAWLIRRSALPDVASAV